jgi:hypothetical protein
MTDVRRKVLARSLYLWIASAAVIGFNTAAALVQDQRLVMPALAITGLLALGGIGFGVWAALTLRAARR